MLRTPPFPSSLPLQALGGSHHRVGVVLQILVGRDIRRVLSNQQRVGACVRAAGNQLIQLPAGVPAGLLALG